MTDHAALRDFHTPITWIKNIPVPLVIALKKTGVHSVEKGLAFALVNPDECISFLKSVKWEEEFAWDFQQFVFGLFLALPKDKIEKYLDLSSETFQVIGEPED